MKTMLCNLCARHCNIVRSQSVNEQHPKFGVCHSAMNPMVARAALHKWEEPCISGTNGSGAVFFSGCNLKCVFCQNYEISSCNTGKEISVHRLKEIYQELI